MSPPAPETGAIRAVLGRLGSEDQEILRLAGWEELTSGEIATVLGISPIAARSRLHRARRRLRAARALRQRVAARSPAQLPGWHVVYTDEEADGFGEMHFVQGAADDNGNPKGVSFTNQVSLAGRVASLTWAPRNQVGGTDRTAGHQSLATGLGVTVHRLIYEGGSRRAFDISAPFIYNGRALEFRATVTEMGHVS
jgi:predicted DNA-binding protein (UPF0251 family)